MKENPLDFYTISVVTPPVEESLKKQAIALGEICFSDSRPTDSADRYCSQKDYYKFIFAREGGVVIGAITLLLRKVPFKDRKILLGGIGGVSTHPSKRNRGVASSMLQVAKKELEESGCDIAFLGTDLDDEMKVGLYQKIGFWQLERQYTYLGKSGKRFFEYDGMIAPFGSLKIYEEVMKDSAPFDIGVGNW